MAQQESYQGLARKWRPQRFEDLVGQEAVAQSFQSALRQGRVVHGHLLAGPRGVGKTTSARILAKALNCEQGPTPTPCGQCRHCLDIAAGNDMDVIEIDAASNTGVDNIRELRERVIQAPFAARYKVYIIDEIHMLSTGAFNALLKTLEEPPPQVVFIFATTELEKVPETIRSRCVVHGFRRLGAEDIARRLEQVAQGEGVTLDPAQAREVYGLVARSVEGGMRDALVVFDQLIALTEGKPDVDSAIKLMGLADQAALTQTVGWLADGNATELLRLIEQLVDRGRSLERFIKSLIAYLRDLMLLQAGVDEQLVAMTGDALVSAKSQARQMSPTTLFNILNQMFELEGKLRQSAQTRFLIEFTFLRIAAVKPVVPIDEILKRVQALPESSLNSGPATPTQTIASPPSSATRPIHRVAQTFPEAQILVMADSATEASTDEPGQKTETAAEGDSPLVGLSREELVEALISQMPDTCRFLGRYLRQASFARQEGAGMRVGWSEKAALARRMIEKTENTSVIEETLTQIAGRPMKFWSETVQESADILQDRPLPAQAGTPQAAPHPRGSTWVHADSAQDDSADAWPNPPIEEASDNQSLLMDGEADEEGKSQESTEQRDAQIHLSTPKPPEPSVDKRNALQKVQALFGTNEDAARRIKILREMFNGKLIDENGQSLPI